MNDGGRMSYAMKPLYCVNGTLSTLPGLTFVLESEYLDIRLKNGAMT